MLQLKNVFNKIDFSVYHVLI